MESLLFGNSQRPAAVVNLTMDEYRKRKEYTDSTGRHYVQFKVSANTQQLLPRKAMVFSSPYIKVMSHKTLATHGPAYLILAARVAALLDGYIEKIRPQTDNEVVLLNHSDETLKNYQSCINKVRRIC